MHPEVRLNPVEVRTRAGATGVGALDYSASFIHTIAAANRSLATLEDEGAFLREQQLEYEALNHFDSAAQWQEYMLAEAEYYVPPDEAMLGSIGRVQGEVVMAEWIRATRFRRSA